MKRYYLDNELKRLSQRPNEDPINLIGVLRVAPVGDVHSYAERLRSLIAAAISITMSADFDSDDVSVEKLPHWFLALSTDTPNEFPGDDGGALGKRRYLEIREDRSWSADEWIYCFDPDLRAWSWWDITVDRANNINVWVDTKGEAHIPCEELWWAIFTSGAENVDSIKLEVATEWFDQPSIGLSL